MAIIRCLIFFLCCCSFSFHTREIHLEHDLNKNRTQNIYKTVTRVLHMFSDYSRFFGCVVNGESLSLSILASFFSLLHGLLLSLQQSGLRAQLYARTHEFPYGDTCTNNSCEFYSQLINSFRIEGAQNSPGLLFFPTSTI